MKLSFPLTSIISRFGIIVFIEVAGVIAQIICRKAETGIEGREYFAKRSSVISLQNLETPFLLCIFAPGVEKTG